MGTQLDCKFANQMIERRLAGVVCFAALLGHDSIGGTRQHHRGRKMLILNYPFNCAGKKIVSSDVYQERFGPLHFVELSIGAWNWINGGSVDDDIEAPEFQDREIHRFSQGWR